MTINEMLMEIADTRKRLFLLHADPNASRIEIVETTAALLCLYDAYVQATAPSGAYVRLSA